MDYKIGDIIQGEVNNFIKIGAFIDIGEGKVGFLHISEISKDYIQVPSDVLSVGDLVTVKVISKENGKIGLSIKQASVLNKEKQFEDMLYKFKLSSEEKMLDIKNNMIKKLK